MNCNVPTDIAFSFTGFRCRGGLTDEHRDGWGIGFFEGRACRLFIDERSTIESPLAEWIRRYPIHSLNVIAHIRKATKGRVALANTHPFQRELWGRYWLFAHNGTLHDYHPSTQFYQAVGETDSERAFCYLLDHLRRYFPSGEPPAQELFAAVRDLADEIGKFGIFNFLLSNGDFLIARCASNLAYIVRRAPFGFAHLIDEDVTIDFRQHTQPNDVVAVIATKPLTDNETWVCMQPGDFVVFRDGEVIKS